MREKSGGPWRQWSWSLGSPIVTGLFGPGWLFPGTPPPQEIQPHTTETLRPQAGHGPGNFVLGTTKVCTSAKTLCWFLCPGSGSNRTPAAGH